MARNSGQKTRQIKRHAACYAVLDLTPCTYTTREADWRIGFRPIIPSFIVLKRARGMLSRKLKVLLLNRPTQTPPQVVSVTSNLTERRILRHKIPHYTQHHQAYPLTGEDSRVRTVSCRPLLMTRGIYGEYTTERAPVAGGRRRRVRGRPYSRHLQSPQP